MNSIKPIETVYRGYRYRSRLEAKWAVFFDSLGIEYRYEEEGFELPDGTRYLPDFWLPDLNYWIEIKGQYPTDEELRKMYCLHEGTDNAVFILYGNIPSANDILDLCLDSCYQLTDAINGLPEQYGCVGTDQHYDIMPFIWGYCPCHNGKDAKSHYCTDDGLALRSPDFGGSWCCKGYHMAKVNDHRLLAAYTAARQARFEHGESPQSGHRLAR